MYDIFFIFFFKQKTAYEMRISDWSSDVCSSDLGLLHLDSTKARHQLGWKPVWSLGDGLAATAQWYKTQGETQAIISREQLQAYVIGARQAGLEWAQA